MSTPSLHRIQVSILYDLRHTPTARFSELMAPTGLESDTFKFHVRKLIKLGYIEKNSVGHYRLTAHGKEFANNLDESRLTTQKQPKLSLLVLAWKQDAAGERRYLFQKRLRNPFYGYWSCIGGPLQWGEDIPETASKELAKQTGLTATCAVRAFYRKRDYSAESEALLEDKLFVIVEAAEVDGEPHSSWPGGQSQWMTIGEFRKQPKYFASVLEAIEMAGKDETYVSKTARYDEADY